MRKPLEKKGYTMAEVESLYEKKNRKKLFRILYDSIYSEYKRKIISRFILQWLFSIIFTGLVVAATIVFGTAPQKPDEIMMPIFTLCAGFVFSIYILILCVIESVKLNDTLIDAEADTYATVVEIVRNLDKYNVEVENEEDDD